jgi:hypothetical protein
VADRAMLLQRGQYIFEAVPGTPLAATKKFTSIELRPAMGADIYDIFGQGDQYARGTGLNTEWTDLAMTGMPTFDEMTPIGALFFGAPTITTPAGATNARQHAWTGVNGTIPTLKANTATPTAPTGFPTCTGATLRSTLPAPVMASASTAR